MQISSKSYGIHQFPNWIDPKKLFFIYSLEFITTEHLVVLLRSVTAECGVECRRL